MDKYIKKILATVAAMLVFAAFARAQSFELGVKAGGTFGKIDGESFQQGYDFGIHAGFYMIVGINNKMGIQPEILFNQTAATTTLTTVENNGAPQGTLTLGDVLNQGEKGHLNYLSIPVLFKYDLVKFLSLQAGPQFGILINQHNTLVQNGENAFKSGDFGLAAGLQLNLGRIKIYGRYNFGLSDISDVTDSDKWHNQQFQVGLGVRIL